MPIRGRNVPRTGQGPGTVVLTQALLCSCQEPEGFCFMGIAGSGSVPFSVNLASTFELREEGKQD